MEDELTKNFHWYLKHQDELAAQHKGRFVAVADCAVAGVYDDEMDAITETRKKHTLGTFMVKRCVPFAEEEIPTFHSRVRFA